MTSEAAARPPVNAFLRNRPFLCRIRNEAYDRARVRFRQAEALFPSSPPLPRELLHGLDALITELEAACEYASEAVRGLRRRYVDRYRHDPVHGVLEEEIVLNHFLEEMATLAHFLRKRVDTDIKIRLYRDRLRRLQTQSPERDGFLQGILDPLNILAEEEIGDLKRILELMERRYHVGDRLMEVLRAKAAEKAEPPFATL